MRPVALALCTAAVLGAAPAPAAEPVLRRFAVVVGASVGGTGRIPLRYATSDAREVSRVLRRLGGVAREDLVLVEEPDAQRLGAALTAVAQRAQRAREEGRRVDLFVYYSGHSDEQGLLLGGSRLAYADLRRALDAVPADVRVAILDSCASGAFTRTKGGVHRPPFLVDASSSLSGHAFLTSSAADETSQESDRLRASFFTHALVTGLRGAADANADGVVTLNEAYQFAYRETLARTETAQSGPQHATFDIALVGSGDVVMTDLRRADAILVVPEPLDGRVFVRNSAGQLVAELRKARGVRLDLALEEGRYDVRLARERRVLAGAVVLPPSGQVILDEAQLAPVAVEATVARGEPDGSTVPAPSPAPAAASPSRWAAPESYALVRGGSFVAQKDLRARWGSGVELAAGVWMREFVGAEIAAGYTAISGSSYAPLVTEDAWTGGTFYTWRGDGKIDERVTTTPVSLSVKLGLPLGRFRPYLLGGTGISIVHFEAEPAQHYDWVIPDSEHLKDDDVFVSFHYGAGAMFRLVPGVFATVEARYTQGTALFDRAFSGKAAEVHTPAIRFRSDAVHLDAGLGVSF